MKTIIVLCVLVAAVVARPDTTYNPKYDNFDAKELVENVRLLKSYAKCFLGEGPCTPEGTEFKKIIPEALRSTCEKCTPKQRDLVRIVINGFKTKVPELWARLVEKQDPKGEFKEAFEKFLAADD